MGIEFLNPNKPSVQNSDDKTRTDDKTSNEKIDVEYPERMKNLHVFDSTEKRTISFAREGGKSRWYTIDPLKPEGYENEGDGDSLYAKISKDGGDEFRLVDGKNMRDVGNFVVGYYNNVNKEILVGGQEYPIAVYQKRRDAEARREKKGTSIFVNGKDPSERDTDVLRQEAYKFCFFDKDADEFITQDLDSYTVTRGEIRNWAEAIQDGDKLTIDQPVSGIYDDGYKVGETGGKKTFEISSLISGGKIKKAEELKRNGDLETAEKLAEGAVLIIKEKGIKDVSQAKYLMQICNEYNLKEKVEIATVLLDSVLNEEITYGGLVAQSVEIKELIGSLVDCSKMDEKLNELKKDVLRDNLANGQAWNAIVFAEKNNLKEELLKDKSKLEEAVIVEISRINSRIVDRRMGETPFTEIKQFLDYGISAEIINKFLGREEKDREIWYQKRDFVDQHYVIDNELKNTLKQYANNKEKSEFKKAIKGIFEVAEKLGISKEDIKKEISEFNKGCGGDDGNGGIFKKIYPNQTLNSLIKLIDEA